jgi:SAM-dependent methyltransferase
MTKSERIELETHNRAQIEYFERAGKHAMQPSFAPYVQRQVDRLVRYGNLSPGERVLDVGCGMGRYTFALADRGLAVEGLDLSEALLEHFRAFDNGRYAIPLHCGDVLNPPPELNKRFDALIGFFTLHHLHDLHGCFQSMRALTRPGGRIVFLEPNPLNLLYYVQMLVVPGMSWKGDKGIVNMRPPNVFRAMEGAGLESLSLHRFGFFPPLVTNRSWGLRLETVFEGVHVWNRFLPFQLFRGDAPAAPVPTHLASDTP